MEDRLFQLIKQLTDFQFEVGESEMHYERLSYAYKEAMTALKQYAPAEVYTKVASNLDD